ncbi:uncharacterized protein LOC110449889 [Mizuhopecten yessoensis]|uniref:uncharacterized protein LOC110449889 n=1 Tax=Mizuhopecten yessoensis TaxID=6573 RepID=UPI000B45F82A|nr:uncharacterized protein LOC110449889 [Mizuhopecten yessoensis]
MMKSMVSLGLCFILLSIFTTTNGQPPFRTFPRRGPPPRFIRGFPGPPRFGAFNFMPPFRRPAFIGGNVFGPPLVGGPGIGGRPIFSQQGNAIFNGNPFVSPFSPVNVLNNGNVGFPTNTFIQGNGFANTGIPPNLGIGTTNTGNVGSTTNTIANLPFGTTNARPGGVVTQTSNTFGNVPFSPANAGTGGAIAQGVGPANSQFPTGIQGGFPATVNTGFTAPVNNVFPGPIPNTGFPGPIPNTGFPQPGFIGSVNTGFPGTIPNTGNVLPTPTNTIGGTNTLTGSGVTAGTFSNQFLLNNGVPALAQVNSLGTQVTSNVQPDGNQDNMVLAAGNSFANRFTLMGGDGAAPIGMMGGETGVGSFQDPTSGQTIAGNTLVNTGAGNTLVNTGAEFVVPVVDPVGASVPIQGTELSPDVAVIGTIGTTDTGAVDPNTLPATTVGSKCQATGCQGGQQCVFAGEYPCAMYLESLECRCQAGCRVRNFFIPEGQSRQTDSCGNVCSCEQTGENRGTAQCTTINCPQP